MQSVLPTLFVRFGVGVLILLVSSMVFVKIAEKLSAFLKISPLIVGMTVVALGTSLPELAVSGIGALRGDVGLSVGNIIGSNIANILLIFAVGILIGKLRIGTKKTQRNSLFLLFITFLFVALSFTQIAIVYKGLLLIGVSLIFTLQEYALGVEGRTREDAKTFKHKNRGKFGVSNILVGVFCLLGIIAGGLMVVFAVEDISLATSYSTAILGLTLTAVATSLPELLATVFSQEDGEAKLTVGNIIGSNIYNITFIGGVTLLFSKTFQVRALDWALLLISSLCFFIATKYFEGRVVPRWVGLMLLCGFVAYILILSNFEHA